MDAMHALVTAWLIAAGAAYLAVGVLAVASWWRNRGDGGKGD